MTESAGYELEYVVEREFDASREMVWRAWTDPELLARWYGPGVETIIHEFDLKPGGSWLILGQCRSILSFGFSQRSSPDTRHRGPRFSSGPGSDSAVVTRNC